MYKICVLSTHLGRRKKQEKQTNAFIIIIFFFFSGRKTPSYLLTHTLFFSVSEVSEQNPPSLVMGMTLARRW